MRVMRLAAMAAVAMSLSAGAASAATELVSAGEYATYHFTFEAGAIGSFTAETHGTVGHWDSTSQTTVLDPQHGNLACSFLPIACTSNGGVSAGDVQFSYTKLPNELWVMIRNNAFDFDLCGPNNQKLCASNLSPVEVNYTEGPGISVDVVRGAVPEPATWAMMIAGFGLVGSALRRRRPAVA